MTTTEEPPPGLKVLPGSGRQLGAIPGEHGVNFAVASAVAEGVTLCLFDEKGDETRLELEEYDAGVWHGLVPGIGHGQAYGYRVRGPFDPGSGTLSPRT